MEMDLEKYHENLLVWDAHRDLHYEMPLKERFLQKGIWNLDLHLPLLKKGGIDVQTYAFCYATMPEAQPAVLAIADIEKTFEAMEENADEVTFVKTVTEAQQAIQAGKIAAFFNFEGGEPIGDDIWLLRFFHRIGFRAMGLTWNYRNALADGGYEGRPGYGLSQFGKSVVKEMNRLGMVVDMAHLTPQSMKDVLATSEKPVIHSHGGIRAENAGHPRTVADDVLEGIARNGGVFCVTTVPDAMRSEKRRAGLEDLFRHIDHAVKVMGEDNVGLGADFDVYQSHLEHPLGEWMEGLEEVDKWANVTDLLLKHGYSDERISKIMGQNLLRVYKDVIGS
jgi:membrane dipeptidase